MKRVSVSEGVMKRVLSMVRGNEEGVSMIRGNEKSVSMLRGNEKG